MSNSPYSMYSKTKQIKNITTAHSKVFVLLILYLLAFTSCSVESYVIMPDYRQDFIENKSLLIIPVNTFQLHTAADVMDDFDSNSPLETYPTFFMENLKDILTRVSSFSNISLDIPQKYVDLRAIEFTIPTRDTTYFYLPHDTAGIKGIKGNIADFILFISKIEISHSWIDIEYGQTPNIRYTLYYLFWDNQLGKVACYGKDSCISHTADRDKEAFREMINNLAQSFITNTPFRKKRNVW